MLARKLRCRRPPRGPPLEAGQVRPYIRHADGVQMPFDGHVAQPLAGVAENLARDDLVASVAGQIGGANAVMRAGKQIVTLP